MVLIDNVDVILAKNVIRVTPVSIPNDYNQNESNIKRYNSGYEEESVDVKTIQQEENMQKLPNKETISSNSQVYPYTHEDRIYAELGTGGGRSGPKPESVKPNYASVKVDDKGYPIARKISTIDDYSDDDDDIVFEEGIIV